jgi:hypothetical protein
MLFLSKRQDFVQNFVVEKLYYIRSRFGSGFRSGTETFPKSEMEPHLHILDPRHLDYTRSMPCFSSELLEDFFIIKIITVPQYWLYGDTYP